MDSNSIGEIFPKTLEILQEKKISYLHEQFHKTLKEQLMISGDADISRWFPVFLKFQGIRPEILEVAEFEYLRHLVDETDLGEVKLDEGQLRINTSVQFVELHHYQAKLARDAGLYCFFKKQDQLLEYKLNIQQALLIDLLHEDRKYNIEQLTLQAAIHTMGASQSLHQWKESVHEMLRLGILIQSNQEGLND